MKTQNKAIDAIIYNFFKILFLFFFICQVVILFWGNLHDEVGYFNNYNILGLAFVVGILNIYIYKYLKNCTSETRVVILIFSITLFPRVLLGCLYQYVPTNDFRNYYEFGWTVAHDIPSGMARAIQTYGMPEMGGVAVLYGIISWLFNGRITGFILVNAIMTSCISVIIFYIGKQYSKEAGIVGALLWAAYPMNIISTQITTNHHGAILFTLLGMYYFDKQYKANYRKRNLYAVISGLCFVISQFWHASIIIPILAVSFYGIMRCLEYRKNKELLLKSAKLLIKVIAIFLIVSNLCLYLFTYISHCEQNRTNFLAKIYVGINKDTIGTYNETDLNMLRQKGDDATAGLIVDRLKSYNIAEFVTLFKNKIELMWIDGDSYAGYWIDAEAQEYYRKLDENELSEDDKKKYEEGFAAVRDIKLLDKIYVNILYVCMFLGVNWRKRKQGTIIDCVIWFILGWIGVHLFIEVQARYRYLAMPYIFIMASIGLIETLDNIKTNAYKRKGTGNRQVPNEEK